jgi:hypothetical protein
VQISGITLCIIQIFYCAKINLSVIFQFLDLDFEKDVILIAQIFLFGAYLQHPPKGRGGRVVCVLSTYITASRNFPANTR